MNEGTQHIQKAGPVTVVPTPAELERRYKHMKHLWQWRYLVYLAQIITFFVLVIVWFHLDTADASASPGPGDKYAIAAFWVAGLSIVGAIILEVVRYIQIWPHQKAWLLTLPPAQQWKWVGGQALKTVGIVYAGEKINKRLRS